MAMYDAIADSYVKQGRSNLKRKVTVDYTYLNLIGDVQGKSVLDLACGDGHYCRPLKNAGAAEVVGVDVSEKMVGIAQAEEEQNPLGIRYACIDALQLPVIGAFDVVLGSFLLHYSSTKEELGAMCRNIYANLRDGGRFVGLNSCPERPLQPDKRYGITRSCKGPLRNGSVIEIVLYEDGKPVCVFNNYHWTKETYEAAFTAAGFKDIGWHGLQVSREGVERFGSPFWGPYLEQPGVVVVTCVR